MQNADIYVKTNSLQKRDASLLLEEFSDVFKGLKSHGKVLDIGCGTADILVELFSPLFKTTVGIDISDDAIAFATEKYRLNNALKFFKMDISQDVAFNKLCAATDYLELGSFDLLTSLFCLHWVGNLSQAFTNIEKFLKPKCRSIVHCATSSSFFGVFVELSKDERFAPYMTNVYDHLPDYHFAEDQMKAFSKNVEAANLELEHIKLKECTHEYQDQKVCQEHFAALNPFIKQMATKLLRKQFTAEYVKKLSMLNDVEVVERNENGNTVIFHYITVTCVARKRTLVISQ